MLPCPGPAAVGAELGQWGHGHSAEGGSKVHSMAACSSVEWRTSCSCKGKGAEGCQGQSTSGCAEGACLCRPGRWTPQSPDGGMCGRIHNTDIYCDLCSFFDIITLGY